MESEKNSLKNTISLYIKNNIRSLNGEAEPFIHELEKELGVHVKLEGVPSYAEISKDKPFTVVAFGTFDDRGNGGVENSTNFDNKVLEFTMDLLLESTQYLIGEKFRAHFEYYEPNEYTECTVSRVEREDSGNIVLWDDEKLIWIDLKQYQSDKIVESAIMPDEKIKYFDWVEKYKPIRGSVVFDDERFETYGEDMEKIKAQLKEDHTKVWTEIEGSDDNDLYVVPGYHHVNRMHHFITEVPWEDETITVSND